LNISENELKTQVQKIRQKLFIIRDKRFHPAKDDKILTNWNGLMIAALAKAAHILRNPKYIEAAQQATKFIFKCLIREDGRLLHRSRDGDAAILANADDYAFLIWGLIELYETTFDISYLEKALNLQEEMIKYFWNREDGGFYFTSDDGEMVLFRQKEI